MKRSDRRTHLKHLMAGAAFLSMPALGQTTTAYPVKPVRVIVPFSTGGGTDVVGRSLLLNMSNILGRSFIIDNKPGAGTVIGSDFVAKAEPDGYTLLMTTSALAINASLVKNLPYNTLSDFAPVGRICHGPNVIVVRAESPFKSLSDIISASKTQPGSLSYASSGTGSAVHMSAELLKLMANINILHIPYRGAAPAYTDLLGGQVDLLVGTAGGVSKFVQSGRMRALAITSKDRSLSYPGIPTVAETVPGYVADVWYGVFAPKGTPANVIETLNTTMRRATDSGTYRASLEGDGLVLALNSPAEMETFMQNEVDRWRKVVQTAKISQE